MYRRILVVCTVIALVSCAQPAAPVSEPADVGPLPSVAALLETDPTREDGASAAAIWIHPSDVQASLVIGAGGTGGLEVYGLDGKRRQLLDETGITQLDLRYAVTLGDRTLPLLMAFAPAAAAVYFYTIDEKGVVVRLPGKGLAIDEEATGLCSFRSPMTGKTYVLVPTDGGMLQQWEIFAGDPGVTGKLVRSVPVGKGVGACVADDSQGLLYLSDETLGVFVLDADPEAASERRAFDLAKPFGSLGGEPKGVALHRGSDGTGIIVVADTGAEGFVAYSLDGKRLGAFQIGAGASADAVTETEGIALAPIALGDRFPGGLFAVTDEKNEGGLSNFKLLSWADVAKAAGLSLPQAVDPRTVRPPDAKIVEPTLETFPAVSFGDAADDPAIWIHPSDPARSAVIATDKHYGMYVYDMAGKLLQSLPEGRMNNTDLRYEFPFADGAAALVTASNRTAKTIAVYRFDARTRLLDNRAAEAIPTGLEDPYGLCMYRSARTGDYFVFINDSEDGRFRQWRLKPAGRNVSAELVREFVVGSQAEGCTADDEYGALYIAEEDVGVWKYSAEPDGGDARTAVDRIGGPNPLAADQEGLSIYYGSGGRGYIVVSNQGANNYSVYRRDGANEYVGTFHVVANQERGIDGSSETDGLDVVSSALGAQFPQGLLVVQDGRNITPDERQNYKYVSWAEIARVLQLDATGAWSPYATPQKR